MEHPNGQDRQAEVTVSGVGTAERFRRFHR